MAEPPIHKFIVFSELDSSGMVMSSFAQCNNCGVIHKIREIGLSDFTRKDSSPAIPSIKEIKNNLPDSLIDYLDAYNLDLPSWQEIEWIINNEQWGRSVILSKEEIDGVLTGKSIVIFSESKWKINNFTREEQIVSND